MLRKLRKEVKGHLSEMSLLLVEILTAGRFPGRNGGIPPPRHLGATVMVSACTTPLVNNE